MAAFRLGQRVRCVRYVTKADYEIMKANGYKPWAGHIPVPLGTEATVVALPQPLYGFMQYKIKADGFDRRCVLGYQIEPLTDSYQLSSWEKLKEIWTPQTEKTHENA